MEPSAVCDPDVVVFSDSASSSCTLRPMNFVRAFLWLNKAEIEILRARTLWSENPAAKWIIFKLYSFR